MIHYNVFSRLIAELVNQILGIPLGGFFRRFRIYRGTSVDRFRFGYIFRFPPSGRQSERNKIRSLAGFYLFGLMSFLPAPLERFRDIGPLRRS